MKTNKKEFFLRIAKASILYAVYLLVSFLTSAIIASETFSDDNIKGFWTDSLYASVAFFYSFLILFSLISIFVLHDRQYRERFISAEKNTKGFGKKLGFIFVSHEFWIDVVTLCVLAATISPISYSNFKVGFLESVDAIWHFPIFMLAFCVGSVILALTAYCSTLNWWSRPAEKRREIQKSKNAKNWLKQLLFSVFMYLLVSPLLSVVIPFIWSVFLTFKMLIVTLTAIMAVGILAYVSFKYVRALYHRRRLMRMMKRALKNGYCRLVYAKDIYRSVFRARDGANICLEKDGKKYYCKLITPLKKKHTLYFGEEGWVSVERHMVMVMHYRSDKYYFDVEDAEKKILVINPGALRVYATDKVHNRELQSGDKVMGYYIYRTDNFINGIERKYL